MELLDAAPEIRVDPAEYRRLLGYPRDYEVSERAQELAAATEAWYREHGRPWLYVRAVDRIDVAGSRICLDGAPFTSQRLAAILRDAEAHGAFLAAVSAGPEAEEEAHRRWRDEKPDEYFFLETYASAVVEYLITVAGARLCAWADGERMAVLPHYSPGYSLWDVAEQSQLLRLMQGGNALPGRLETLESGALRPKKSQLAVFGLTRHVDRVQRLTELVPCQSCSFANCPFRRAPYRRASTPANYSVNPRALARWAAERLALTTRADGAIEARFRYDGTTCTNMGRSLSFQYDVLLGPPQDGYQIREQHCAPVSGDSGYTAMCQYQTSAGPLLAAIEREKPLIGQPLDSVLAWRRDSSPAGCYCDAASRQHKWGLVLETIHYALHKNDQPR
ncbi:MAG TPA: hypothetical protein VHW09_10735 [Bryobacteraceae bacterium]|jgi:hypothetical protein|nr:hypothetical protein [Bryobacteraceae bacterium]